MICRPFVCLVLAVVASGLTSRTQMARACGAQQPKPPAGIPRSGATNVSPTTSVVVASQTEPTGLALSAGGTSLPIQRMMALGAGWDSVTAAGTRFWRLDAGILPASSEIVLTQATAGAATPIEVTRFTTAASYDKAGGTPPALRSLRLWRVRYPLNEISSGNCVFAEYHGFISVDYDPATVPNTPAGSVLHTFHLAPETGGGEQTFVHAGADVFTGAAPEGDHPLPTGLWQPELDPTRRYCLSITAVGDGDLGRSTLESIPVCANVNQLSASGAPPSPVVSSEGSGCAISGSARPRSASLAWAFGALLAVISRVRRRPR